MEFQIELSNKMLRGARILRKATITVCIIACFMSVYAFIKTKSPIHLIALGVWITLLITIHYTIKI